MFSNCSSLTHIDLSECKSLTSISDYTFINCSKLESVIFPSSLISIGTRAFYGCVALKEVDMMECTLLTSINSFAFSGCSNLTSIVLPSSLSFIDNGAFAGCKNLMKITTHATTPPRIEYSSYHAFDEVDRSIPVYVPKGTVDAHKVADGWKEFNNILELSTGLSNMDAADALVVQGNNIVLNEAQQVAVYSATGALVYQGFTDSITIVEPGLYIVRIAGGAVKIIIR